MLEVREARYFIAVAEELNFGRAAARLQMSQPPLSAAIKALEKRLGVLLLHRTTREVTVTSAGMVFLDHAACLWQRPKRPTPLPARPQRGRPASSGSAP